MTSKDFGAKKQGAGTSTEHYIQDAAEIWLTARLQEEVEREELPLRTFLQKSMRNF